MTGEAMREHSDAVTRLADIPGIRVVAAEQIIAEAGATAKAFDSPGQFSSWIGVSPGRNESAERNRSSRCPKGNPYIRRVLCQAAQAAVRTNNSLFQRKFKRLLAKHGYVKSIWAIARHLSVVIWKVLHEGAHYIEYGGKTSAAAAKRRVLRVKKELCDLGFSDKLQPLSPDASGAPAV